MFLLICWTACSSYFVKSPAMQSSRGLPHSMPSASLLADPREHQEFELGLMIEQPVEVEKPLVDDVLVGRALVLDNAGAAVFVDSEGVDPAAVRLARLILAGEEPDAQKNVEVLFDERLKRFLQGNRLAFKFANRVSVSAEQLDVAQGSPP